MKRILVILAFAAFLLSQQAQITNIQVAQRTDGSKLVDITYDLTEDALFADFNVHVEVSFDGGVNWELTYQVEGDVFGGIMPGEGKAIVWTLPGEEYSDNVRVRLTATGTIAGAPPFEMVDIPAGEYTFGEGDAIQTIDYDYEISKYPITNAQYVVFLIEALELGIVTTEGWGGSGVGGFFAGNEHYSAGDYKYHSLSAAAITWNGTTFIVNEGYGDHPVTSVSWFGAIALAEYYSLRLPDEYEWEKAARGNTGYDYPWGNSIDGSQANYWNSGDPWDNNTTPVGFYNGQNYEGFQTTDSPSPYGAYDMAGNVGEWTATWISSAGNRQIWKGGHWDNWYPVTYCRSWVRLHENPESIFDAFGFRVARTQ